MQSIFEAKVFFDLWEKTEMQPLLNAIVTLDDNFDNFYALSQIVVIRGILDSLSLDSLPLSWFSSNHRLEIRSTRTVKSRHCSLRHITVRNKNLESSILRMLPRISRQQNWFWLEEFYWDFLTWRSRLESTKKFSDRFPIIGFLSGAQSSPISLCLYFRIKVCENYQNCLI